MNLYTSNLDLLEAAEIIRAARRVTVITHAKPDGDAMGAVIAMSEALRGLDHEVTAWIVPPLADSLGSLRGAERVRPFEAAAAVEDTDLLIVLDTGASSQLGALGDQLGPHLDHTLVVDHHLSGDLGARWRYVDQQAAACCEILVGLLDAMDVGLNDLLICEALFVGIAADTGWFRFSNTRPQTHEAAARLLRAGVDHARLHAQLHQTERPQKLALMVRALASLKLLGGGDVALMQLQPQDFTQTGADLRDVEQFVDIPQMVASVQTVVLISQPPAPKDARQEEWVRVSLRSKPGPDAVNVAELARRLGGGGHARAAGVKMPGPIEKVVEQVTKALGKRT